MPFEEAPIPPDEKERLEALYKCSILDTLSEERFDKFTRLAATVLNKKIALVSLVDSSRQWFKSHFGLDVPETPRNISFCGHAIMDDEILVVEDALLDDRFSENPLVMGAPGIRFYAGAPLRSKDSFRIGTLCIIDDSPAGFTKQDRQILKDLAECVENEINQIENISQKKELELTQALNQSIQNTQQKFIQERDRNTAFDGLLSDILRLTDSEYGFIGEVLRTPSGDPYLKTYAITNISWNDETRKFYDEHAPGGMEFYNLKTLFGAALTSKKPVIANQPAADPRRGGLPEGHPDLNSFLGVPIFHGVNMVAMLGIANRPGGYSEENLEFLHPLLGTIGQLIHAAKIKKENDENQVKISRLSLVASQTANGVAITDGEGRIEWVNGGISQITEFSEKDLLGFYLQELLIGENSNPDDIKKIHDAILKEKSFNLELKNKKKSGQSYWLKVNCDPVRTPSGDLQGYLAVATEITEQKQIEGELRRFKSTVDRALDCVFMFDPDALQYFYVNDGAVNHVGYSREEFSRLHPYDIMVKISEAEFRDMILPLLMREKKSIYFETVHKHKNGTLIPVEIFIQYIPPSDEPGRFVAFVRDISERKRIEMMKNQFISTVSHELRTPLTAVNGAISLISSGKIEPSRASDLIGIAQKNAMRLAELIDDLLDMEKLSQGKIRMEIEKKNLTEILQQSLNQIQSYNADSEITFRFLSEPKAVFVNVDEKRLQQVMANLLSNAAKFSPEKSSVDVSLHRNNGNVRVEVKDYGSGIPEEFRSRIFHKFAQADSSDSRKKGGTGLGLAISKELIQQMGGRIGFHSGKKGGCTFYFELPVAS